MFGCYAGIKGVNQSCAYQWNKEH